MIFIILTFLAAFTIEGIGTLVSVIGLSTLFGANPIIIALAIALDAGKLVVVTLLYSYWQKLGKLMKSYALIAAAITMIITSAGAAGYLSGEFQKAILGTQEGSLKVDVLKGQIAKYEERKKQIDSQIANLPEKTSVTQRLRLMNGFKAEQKDLQDKIAAIDSQLPELQIKQIGVEAKAGPILYIAKAFDIPVETAVKWVILLIIFVFDPLAVFLIIAGNFLLHQRRVHKDTSVANADLFDEPKNGFTPPEPMPPAFAPPPEDEVEDLRTMPADFAMLDHHELVRRFGAPEIEDPDTIPDVVPPAEPALSDEEKFWQEQENIQAERRAQRVIQEAAERQMELETDGTEVQVANPPDSQTLDFYTKASAPVPIDLPAPVLAPDLSFREPAPQEEIVPIEPAPPVREQITLSSLGLVRPDPHTIVDAGALTPVNRPDIYR